MLSELNLTKFLQDVQKWLPIVTFQSISERRKIVGESRQKIAHFNSVNSAIIGLMLTKFVHDVAQILPFRLFETD